MLDYRYAEPEIRDEDIDAVTRVLRARNHLTQGPQVQAFAHDIAGWYGGDLTCRVLSSATSALRLVFQVLKKRHGGDFVVVPSITYRATANAALAAGLQVVVADVEPESGLMTARTLDTALEDAKTLLPGARCCAIVPVDLGGFIADVRHSEAYKEGVIPIVRDAAHSFGSTLPDASLQKEKINSEITVFSFHAIKTIACGEGGAVLTGRRWRDVAVEVGALANQGDFPGEYSEDFIPGDNCRMTEMQAALGRSQMLRFNEIKAKRRALFDAYDKALVHARATVEPWLLPRRFYPTPVLYSAGPERPCPHLYRVRVYGNASPGPPLQNVQQALQARGIETRRHYEPLHLYYAKDAKPEDYDGANGYWERTLSLPFHTRLEAVDVERIVENLYDVLRG